MSLDTLAAAAPVAEVATEVTAPTVAETTNEAPTVDSIVADSQVATPEAGQAPVEAPEWLQSKYVTEGRSQDESIAEQAKAYTELSSKLGSFTGAPETYESFAFGEELTKTMADKGISMLNADDPLMAGMGEIAKDLNMSQEGYNKFAEAFVGNQIAQEDARIANVVAELGENAPARIKEIQQWQAGLTPEVKALTDAVATTAEGIELLEHFMGQGNKMPNMTRTPSEEMKVADPRAALDAMTADPRNSKQGAEGDAYRAEVAKMASRLFPS